MNDEKNNVLNKLFYNTNWLMIQNIYSMVLSLVIGSISARYLGPENYGLIGYGTSIVAIFVSVSKLGLDSVVINEIVVRPEKKSSYLGTALYLRLFSSIVSIGCIFIFVNLFEPNNQILHIVVMLQSLEIIMLVYEVFNYWFQVELKSKYFVISSMIALTITSIWRIILLWMNAGVIWFAFSSSIQAAIILLVTFLLFNKFSKLKIKFNMRDAKYLFSKSYHYIISNLAVTLYLQIDRVMLGNMIGEVEVGYYTAASTIAALWQFIPIALINSARPVIISAKKENYRLFIKRLRILFLAITIMAIIVGIGMNIVGELLLQILYGKQYIESSASLKILVWATGFAVIGTARGIWLISEGFNKYEKYMVLLGAILNIILNKYAIDHWKITGASVVTLISQFFVAFLAPLLFKDTRRFLRIYLGSYKELHYILQFVKKKRQ